MPRFNNKAQIPNKVNFKSLGRTISLMWKGNEVKTVLMIVFSLIFSITTAMGMSFTRPLFDEVIPKMIETNGGEEAVGDLISLIFRWGLLLVISVIASTIQLFIAVSVSQKTIKVVREKMFSNMQYLPFNIIL